MTLDDETNTSGTVVLMPAPPAPTPVANRSFGPFTTPSATCNKANPPPSMPAWNTENQSAEPMPPMSSAVSDTAPTPGPASVTAGVEAFTDPQLAKILVSKMRKSDGKLPRFYQILLKIRSMDDTPLEITYVLHKELQPAGQMGR